MPVKVKGLHVSPCGRRGLTAGRLRLVAISALKLNRTGQQPRFRVCRLQKARPIGRLNVGQPLFRRRFCAEGRLAGKHMQGVIEPQSSARTLD